MAFRSYGARGTPRVLLVAASLASGGCEGTSDDPSAGQTGSPVVSPDYESPAPFRPPPEEPPTNGPESPVPRRSLEDPPRVASFGSWLYVATPRGLLGVDTSANPLPVDPVLILAGAIPLWVSVDGAALDVIAEFVDEAAVEGAVEPRLLRFDLSGDPARPVLLASVNLPGLLQLVRQSPGRLVTLSAETEPPPCAPRSWYGGGGRWRTGRLVARDFRLDGDAWAVRDEVAVEAKGFVETEAGIVLSSGGEVRPTVLTLLETPETGLEATWSATLDGTVPHLAPMLATTERIALFLDAPTGSQLAVVERSSAGARGVPVPSSQENATFSAVAGRFFLVPGDVNGTASTPGAIVDWQAESGPVITAELPPGLWGFKPIGERWYARSIERSVLFRIGPTGSFDLEAEFDPSPGTWIDSHWELGSGRALFPYSIPLSGDGVGVPREFGFAVLDTTGSEPVWQLGPKMSGHPLFAPFDSLGDRSSLQIQRSNDALFLLSTLGSEYFQVSWLLEHIDLSAPDTEVVSLARTAVATSLTEQGWADIRATYDGRRNLRIGTTDADIAAMDLPLDYGAESLVRRDDGWLAFTLRDSNACSPPVGDPPGSHGPCLPEGRAAVHVATVEPPALVSSTPLPDSEPTPRGTDLASHEWLELVAQGDHAALLEHRGIVCRSEADCTALGIEFETRTNGGGFMMCDDSDPVCANPEPIPPTTTVQGQQDQRWLYPFDVAEATFAPPLRLDDIDPYGWITADGLRVESGAALWHFIPIERRDARVLRARNELLLMPSLDAPGVENLQRITVPGYPLYVGDGRAVTVEPAAALLDGAPLPGALLHRLSLQNGLAYIEQTLELPGGHAGHLWAEQRGYLLLVPEDVCAEPVSTLFSVRDSGTRLDEEGSLALSGTGWRLAEASDQLARLVRSVERFEQHALVEASDDGPRLREIQTRPSGAPVSISGARARLAPVH